MSTFASKDTRVELLDGYTQFSRPSPSLMACLLQLNETLAQRHGGKYV